MGTYNCTSTLENSLAISLKVRYIPTIAAAILLLGMYPIEMEAYIHRPVYTSFWHSSLFIAVLFVLAQNWKQPKCQPKANG